MVDIPQNHQESQDETSRLPNQNQSSGIVHRAKNLTLALLAIGLSGCIDVYMVRQDHPRGYHRESLPPVIVVREVRKPRPSPPIISIESGHGPHRKGHKRNH